MSFGKAVRNIAITSWEACLLSVGLFYFKFPLKPASMCHSFLVDRNKTKIKRKHSVTVFMDKPPPQKWTDDY